MIRHRELRLVNFNSFSRGASMLCKTMPWGGERIKKSSENLIPRIKRWATRENVFLPLSLTLKRRWRISPSKSIQFSKRFCADSSFASRKLQGVFVIILISVLWQTFDRKQISTSAARSKRPHGRESRRAVNLLCNLSFLRRNSRTWLRCLFGFVCQALRLFIVNFANDGQSRARNN